MPATPGFPEFGGIGDRLSRVEQAVRDMLLARRLESATIGAGGLTFDGGQAIWIDSSGNVLFTIDENGLITFEADGSQMSVLDAGKLRFNRADGTRQLEITPGGGAKFYEANGTTVLTTLDSSGVQVGTDVVIDSTGLHVDGGDVRALDVGGDESFVSTATLTTTSSEKTFHTLAVPTWATSALVQCIAQTQSSDGGFGPLGIRAEARIDSVNDGGAQVNTAGLISQATHVTTKVLASPGSTVRFSCYANRSGGSGDPTSAQCVVRSLAVFLR